MATDWLKADRVGHLIGGSSINDGKRTLNVTNPSTGECVRRVLAGGKVEVDQAVTAAMKAFPEWAATTPVARARLMSRFLRLLEENADMIARVVGAEHGKTTADAKGELQRGMENIEFAISIPTMLRGSFTRDVGRGVDSLADRFPLGVCAGITPFNFPAMVPLWMYPLAIACGNCFVLKPSEKDPSAATLVAEFFHEAGFPAGVLNVVQGDRDVVEAILEHPAIQAISFVGSTPVAETIYRVGSMNGKRVQALGGAKNHMIIMPDADLDQATDALIGSAYGSAGERCMAISVAIPVGEATANALREKLEPRVREVRVGATHDPDADMGPLVTAQHRDKVVGYIEQGVADGAELVVDGRGVRLQGYENGHYVGATCFDHVKPNMSIYREEIFGPVLSVVRSDSYEEALHLINVHEFGNGTSIFTRDGDVARHFTIHVQAGMVGVNVPIPVPVSYHSFGGWKRSLFGDHSIYGPEGIHFYTRLKTSTVRWPTGIRSGAAFTFPSLN